MKVNKEIKIGSVLYSVDPLRLVIDHAYVTDIKDGYASISRDRPYPSKAKSGIKIALDKLPVEYKGHIYFINEEDALQFIQIQVGL